MHLGFIWRQVTAPEGIVDLNGAHVGDLVDDMQSWPPAGRLTLHGFTYDRISGAPTDAPQRLRWLAKGSSWNGEFFPQPYTQLAKVLRDMGHDAEARKVLAERERLLYREKSTTHWTLHNGNVKEGIPMVTTHYFTILWSWLLRGIVGYGHAPFRSVIALVLLWAGAAIFAHLAWEEGSFAPNSGPVLLSAEWQGFAALAPLPTRRTCGPPKARRDRIVKASASTPMPPIWSFPSSTSARPPPGPPRPRAVTGGIICGGCAGFSRWRGGSSRP